METPVRSTLSTLAVLLFAGCAGTATCPGTRTPPMPKTFAAPTSAPAATRDRGATFSEHARRLGYTFRRPSGFSDLAPKDNDDVSYDHRVSNGKGLEVRYTLHPAADGASSDEMAAQVFFMAGVLNIARGAEAGDTRALPAHEFGAHSAHAVDLKLDAAVDEPTAFARGFRFCSATLLHRDDVGDAWLFVLAKDRDAMRALTDEVIHSLVFAAAAK